MDNCSISSHETSTTDNVCLATSSRLQRPTSSTGEDVDPMHLPLRVCTIRHLAAAQTEDAPTACFVNPDVCCNDDGHPKEGLFHHVHAYHDWPCPAIMMEPCVEAQMSICLPVIKHVSRVYNTWADALSNDNTHPSAPRRITLCDSNK